MNKISEVNTNNGIRALFFDMIDYLLMDSSLTIEEACTTAFRDRIGNEPLPEELALILTQAKPVEEYVRMCYRERVVKTILDYGLDITVIGGNWDRSDLKFVSKSNFHWIPSMPFADVFTYMQKSRVCLTVMPWFKAGSHERIFNTLLSGVCPISDKSKWLEENFTDKEDIAFYDLDNLEALPVLIEELLQNSDLREKIIRKGQEKVLQYYTTEHVIGEVLQKVIDLYYT